LSDAHDIYTFPNHTTESGTINKVTMYSPQAKGEQSTTATLAYKSGDSYAYSSVYSGHAAGDMIWEMTTNPISAVAWTWDDIDNFLGGFKVIALDQKWAGFDFFQLYIEVDYTPGWANIKNIRAGTGSITATDLASIWFGTTEVAVADIAEIPVGVAV
jgi:hypothetical protein